MNDDPRLCNLLDNYLTGSLPAERAAEFDNHFNTCELCRQAVDDWHSIQNILQRATTELESPSEQLLKRLQVGRVTPERQTSRRKVVWRAAIAGTCAVLLAGILFVTFAWKPPRQEELVQETPAVLKSITIAPAPDVKLPNDVIGVPIDIDDPNVTVVWIYPVTSSDKKPLSLSIPNSSVTLTARSFR